MGNPYVLSGSGLIFFLVCYAVQRYSQEHVLSFFDHFGKVRRLFTVFYIALGLLLVMDFVVHKHEAVELGSAPLFYAVYGFVSGSALIFVAKVLGSVFKQNAKDHTKK